MLGRPPRRTARVRLRRPRSQALPGRRLRRLATTVDEKSGLSTLERTYCNVCGERDGSSSRSDDELDALHHGGGATKKSACRVATRRADGGCGRSLRSSSSKMARHRLPPPALISPHKPHLHTLQYLRSSVLRVCAKITRILASHLHTIFGRSSIAKSST